MFPLFTVKSPETTDEIVSVPIVPCVAEKLKTERDDVADVPVAVVKAIPVLNVCNAPQLYAVEVENDTVEVETASPPIVIEPEAFSARTPVEEVNVNLELLNPEDAFEPKKMTLPTPNVLDVTSSLSLFRFEREIVVFVRNVFRVSVVSVSVIVEPAPGEPKNPITRTAPTKIAPKLISKSFMILIRSTSLGLMILIRSTSFAPKIRLSYARLKSSRPRQWGR